MKRIRGGNIIFLTILCLSALCCSYTSANDSADSSATFTVSIPEKITVTIDGDAGASGTPGTFLRNLVTISVKSNNQYGFSTTMKTKDSTTDLVNVNNDEYTIPTLSEETTQAEFSSNYWGFSEDDTETVSGTSTYKPVSAEAITLTGVSANSAGSKNENIYFGMKADSTQVAGIYKNTMVIVVVGKVSGE